MPRYLRSKAVFNRRREGFSPKGSEMHRLQGLCVVSYLKLWVSWQEVRGTTEHELTGDGEMFLLSLQL